MDNVAEQLTVVKQHVALKHVVLNIHLGRDIRMSAHLVVPEVESDVANTNKKCLFLTFSLKTLLNHRNLIFKAIIIIIFTNFLLIYNISLSKTLDY